MSGLGSWLWGQPQIDDAVERATSELLPAGSSDIALSLEICDQIRSKTVSPKDAMRSLKKRLNHRNPNVQLLTLQLTDICVKNGGDPFLVEIASREFQDNLVSILKMPALNWDVKQLILRLIQNWGIAFEARPSASYVSVVYKNLQNEGFNFPPRDMAATSAAMVSTETAPEWIDSEVCLRCRTPFSFTNRKHHCRNCGQVFDHQCSSKNMPLPHFGITVPVRVCDGCHAKLLRKAESHKPRSPHSRSNGHNRSARSLADEELQRAIELSLQEANAGSTPASAPSSYNPRPGYAPSYAFQNVHAPPIRHDSRPSTNKSIEEQEEEQLKAAIEASLKDVNSHVPSQPQQTSSYGGYYSGYQPPSMAPSAPMPYDLSPNESDAILTFSSSVDGNPHNPAAINQMSSMYSTTSSLYPKLATSLQDTQQKEAVLSGMNDKMSEVVRLYEEKMTLQRRELEELRARQWQQQQQPAYAGYQPQAGYQQPQMTGSAPYQQPQTTGSTQYQQPYQTQAPYQQPQTTGAQPQPWSNVPQSTPTPTPHQQQYAPPASTSYAPVPQQVPGTPAPYQGYEQPHPHAAIQSPPPQQAYPGYQPQPQQQPPQQQYGEQQPQQSAYTAPSSVSTTTTYQPQSQPQQQYQQPSAPPTLSPQGSYYGAPAPTSSAPQAQVPAQQQAYGQPAAAPQQQQQQPASYQPQPPQQTTYQPQYQQQQPAAPEQISTFQPQPQQAQYQPPAPSASAPVEYQPQPVQQQTQYQPSAPVEYQPAPAAVAPPSAPQESPSAQYQQFPPGLAAPSAPESASPQQQMQFAPAPAPVTYAQQQPTSPGGGEDKYAALANLQVQLSSPPATQATFPASSITSPPPVQQQQQQQQQYQQQQQQYAPPQQHQQQYAPPPQQQQYAPAPQQPQLQPSLFPAAPTGVPQHQQVYAAPEPQKELIQL
ncbi:putative vacuolar sorting-associated protein [Flagelloscypha sp. PMI_526]|nr:putative vacuolar sorting-associated protein [Flagelloscypha sp. PMI_526]